MNILSILVLVVYAIVIIAGFWEIYYTYRSPEATKEILAFWNTTNIIFWMIWLSVSLVLGGLL